MRSHLVARHSSLCRTHLKFDSSTMTASAFYLRRRSPRPLRLNLLLRNPPSPETNLFRQMYTLGVNTTFLLQVLTKSRA
jgi:hypothetical protein